MAPYAKKTIALDNIMNKQEVIPSGVQIPDITVLRLPAAAQDAVTLQVGDSGDAIDLIQGMSLRINPPESTGLFVSSSAAFAGQSLKLLIGYVAATPRPLVDE